MASQLIILLIPIILGLIFNISLNWFVLIPLLLLTISNSIPPARPGIKESMAKLFLLVSIILLGSHALWALLAMELGLLLYLQKEDFKNRIFVFIPAFFLILYQYSTTISGVEVVDLKLFLAMVVTFRVFTVLVEKIFIRKNILLVIFYPTLIATLLSESMLIKCILIIAGTVTLAKYFFKKSNTGVYPLLCFGISNVFVNLGISTKSFAVAIIYLALSIDIIDSKVKTLTKISLAILLMITLSTNLNTSMDGYYLGFSVASLALLALSTIAIFKNANFCIVDEIAAARVDKIMYLTGGILLVV